MRAGPRALLSAGIALLLIVLAPALPQPIQAARLPHPAVPFIQKDRPLLPTPAGLEAQRLIELANQARWKNGQIPPLKWNAALGLAAQSHCQDMAENNFFSHADTVFSSPWERIESAGYGDWYALAENIAAGYRRSEDVVQAWMDSPHHRANLLNAELHEAGAGYVYQAGDTYPGTTWGYERYWTLDMGSRWDTYPLVIAGEAFSTTSRQVQVYLYGAGWASEMRLSNDGFTWTPWRPYKPLLTWDLLPGNGTKRVYGQVRNREGTVVQAEDEIVLIEAGMPLIRPTAATFILQQGNSIGWPARYPVQVTDPGGAIRNWYASWDRGWLRLSASAGTIPARVWLVLTDEARLLPAGVYTATLSFQGPGKKVSVPVRLIVSPRVYSTFLPLVPKK